MQLFRFECRLIIKHKLYALYVISFLLLFFLTIQPFSLGKNFAPMDESHILLRMLLKDSEKKEIQNEFLEDRLEALVSANVDGRLTEEILFVEEHRNIILSGNQKSFLDKKTNEVINKLGNGNYSKNELLAMDTTQFQKLEIALSVVEINLLLDEVDKELGGWTHFAAYGLDDGESYRKDCVEIGAYNNSFGNRYQPDGSSIRCSGEELLTNYDMEVEKSGYTGMFVPFVLDKLGLMLSLSMAFVLALFHLSHQGCTKDVIAIKECSAFKYIGTKCAGMVCMAFLPCLVSILFLNIRLCMQGMSFGYDVNPYSMFIGAFLVLLPQIIFLTVIGMLATIILNSLVAPFLLEAVFFCVSVNDFYGCYGLDRIVLRFNLLAHSDLACVFLKDVIWNRIVICFFSVVIFGLLILLYHMQKYGKVVWRFPWIQGKQEKLSLWKKNVENLLERKRIQKQEESGFGKRSILSYLFQLGYWKGVGYCLILDMVVGYIFQGDMTGEEILMRFFPLNAIVLFSVIGFAQQEGHCSDLIMLKNRIHIYLQQFITSGLLVTMFVCGFGKICFGCSWGVIGDVLLFSMILGSIYTVFRKQLGVVIGTFSAVLIYIFVAISML